MSACVIPGSFDPITLGHMDIIRRACALFDRVTVAVLNNVNKEAAFTLEERKAMIEAATRELSVVRVDAFSGALPDYMDRQGILAVVRGVRGSQDFAMEMQLAAVYRAVNPKVDMLLLPADGALAHISSSAVREVAKFGKDLTGWVPAVNIDQVARRFRV